MDREMWTKKFLMQMVAETILGLSLQPAFEKAIP